MARAQVETHCEVEIERTRDSLLAHAVPEEMIHPGDIVQVHDAPTAIAFGATLRRDCRATVYRAGPLARIWTRLTGVFGIGELYEVGFAPKEER